MGFRIQGAGGLIANVVDGGDQGNAVLVTLPQDKAASGYARMLSEVDDGAVLGAATTRPPEVSEDYRLRVGLDTLAFNETFPGATLNARQWSAPTTTMSITVASGYARLNANNTVSINTAAQIRTYRQFPCFQSFMTWFEFRAAFTDNYQNYVAELGALIASGTSAPTDGAFFRRLANGEFRAVLNNNGIEVQSDDLGFNALVGVNTTRHFIIGVSQDGVEFWIDNQLVATIGTPVGSGMPTSSNSLPLAFRIYIGGVVALQPVNLLVGAAMVHFGDMHAAMDLLTALASAGAMGYQGQTGGTEGSTSFYLNSSTPVAGSLSNTTALATGLGGQARFNAAAGGTTDGIVLSYQAPAGTAALPGRVLCITGLKISCCNNGAAVATTPTTLAWSIAFGHTAVSLATTTSATGKSPIRLAAGIMNWPVGAAIGAKNEGGSDLELDFTSAPIAVNPGEYFAVVAKFLNGTATASQVIDAHITVRSAWI